MKQAMGATTSAPSTHWRLTRSTTASAVVSAPVAASAATAKSEIRRGPSGVRNITVVAAPLLALSMLDTFGFSARHGVTEPPHLTERVRGPRWRHASAYRREARHSRLYITTGA